MARDTRGVGSDKIILQSWAMSTDDDAIDSQLFSGVNDLIVDCPPSNVEDG